MFAPFADFASTLTETVSAASEPFGLVLWGVGLIALSLVLRVQRRSATNEQTTARDKRLSAAIPQTHV